MVLLLFVLVGLLVMRRRTEATFGLTRVLWQQVRCRPYFFYFIIFTAILILPFFFLFS